MIVDIIPSLKELTPQKIYGKTAIVLDIFRCTSTIITASANGCSEIIPVLNAEEAVEVSSKLEQGSFIIAGESGGKKFSSFDLGNSPYEFTKEKVYGKKIILTTTNGTRAIKACKPAKNVLIGGFINAGAVTSYALGYSRDIVIVCSGSKGRLALEDVMGAGFIVSQLKQYTEEIRQSELAKTFYYLHKYFKEHLSKILATTRSGFNLKKLGYAADMDFCLQKNIYKIVPILRNNSIKTAHSLLISNYVN